MSLFTLRLEVIDLWMSQGRHDPEVFASSMKASKRLYRLVRDTQSKHVVEVSDRHTYRPAFLAGALPEGGMVVTVFRNGLWCGREEEENGDASKFIPKRLQSRHRVLNGWEAVPSASVDLVVDDGDEGVAPEPEVLRILKPGGALSMGGKVRRVWALNNESGADAETWHR